MSLKEKLDYVTVKGFKSIASIERLPLNSINIIVGANGSGKSNFIGAFSFLHSVREGRLQDYVRRTGGANQLLHFGSKATPRMEFELSFKDEMNGYRLDLSATQDDSLYPSREEALFWDKSRGFGSPYIEYLDPQGAGREAGISNPRLIRTPGWVQHRLSLWRLYHVHDTSPTSPMRQTAKLDDNAYLRPDGANLAAFLYLLKEKHSSEYDLIRATVQLVAPFFDDFLLRPDPLNEEAIRLAWKHKRSDQYFNASALSDGSLRFILLATLFLQPQKYLPSIVLVDEPELGLHPYAIGLLASLVRQVSARAQVIVSTQSPLLLDYFEPEEVLVARRDGGGTILNRLESAPLKDWLSDYSLGQLWEKNEIGGRPTPE
ncbi:putative ATPase [Bradyrhizobium sp. USDA 4449]